MVGVEQEFGGVGHLSETRAEHLVDAQFGGRTETVLDGTEDAVHIMLVAFKLEDSIDDVFEHLRTSQRAFLGDVADEDDGRARLLGELEDTGGTFAHLTNAACTRLEVIGGDGLDGVDDEDVGLDIGDVGEDGVEVGFAGDVDGVEGIRTQAGGTELELVGGFFA